MRTIVWDVDDVMNAFTREWLMREWLPRNPNCRLTFHELTRNPPHELLCVTLDEYRGSIDRFRESAAGRALQPLPEVRTWFESYGARFRHVALTARPLASVPHAAAWVFASAARGGEGADQFLITASSGPGHRARIHWVWRPNR